MELAEVGLSPDGREAWARVRPSAEGGRFLLKASGGHEALVDELTIDVNPGSATTLQNHHLRGANSCQRVLGILASYLPPKKGEVATYEVEDGVRGQLADGMALELAAGEVVELAPYSPAN